ncbi:hypothetical protein BDV06DRAFT_218971 [Aspergillus oleicola]
MSRKYPLAKPTGHKPPMERWKLDFTSPTAIHTTYIGVQRHDSTPDTLSSYTQAVEAIQSKLTNTISENFTFIEGDDAPESTIWVSYSTPPTTDHNQINLLPIYEALNKPSKIGLWTESFTTPTNRLETNYSGLDYLPGLARLPGTGSKVTGHELTAYWGAARDRIPDSGTDLFPSPSPEDAELRLVTGRKQPILGRRLYGTNTVDNIVHIRSGQFWANCTEEESTAYEENLEPALMQGLRYVWSNRPESGALGLRFLRNAHTHGPSAPSKGNLPSSPCPAPEQSATGAKEKETCASGFFRNLSDLEKWAKGHPSHHKIFNGAIRHARVFGEGRKFRTWHEVSVLKKEEVAFEYLNCVEGTGVSGFVELEGEEL